MTDDTYGVNPHAPKETGRPRPTSGIAYDGKTGKLFGMGLKIARLSLLTLGFYRFWGKTQIRRYLASRISIGSNRFEYTGTGKELFLGFLIALAVLIPLGVASAGIEIFLAGQPAWMQIALPPIQYAFILFLIGYATFRARRYRLSRTVLRSVRFWQTGSSVGYALRMMGYLALTIVTLGIARPIGDIALYRYLMQHTWFGSQKFQFNGRAGQMMGKWILSLLLAPFTLGLSLIWYAAFRMSYLQSQTRYQGIQFSMPVTFGNLLRIYSPYALAIMVLLILFYTAILATFLPAIMAGQPIDLEIWKSENFVTINGVGIVAAFIVLGVIAPLLKLVLLTHRFIGLVAGKLVFIGDDNSTQSYRMPLNGQNPVKGWPMRSISVVVWKSAFDAAMTQQADYFDGKTASRHDIILQFEAAGLQITGDAISDFWPYANIRRASEDPSDRPLTFRCQSSHMAAARLIVGDQAIIGTLQIRCVDLEDRIRRSQLRKRGTVWAGVGIASLALAIWSFVHFLPGIVAPMIPIAWEESLGNDVVDDIASIFGTITKKKVKQCETADGRLALEILVGQLVNQIQTPYQFQVTVLDIDMVNALAAPGGRIVIFKKLLAEARSPDEVAGVFAHEMGHVISRHPTEAVARNKGLSLIFNVLIGGLGSGVTGAAGQALVNSAYSRDAERVSDQIALDILRGAQISPKGIADFFQRMSNEEGNTIGALSFISSHPPSDDRANAARNAGAATTHPALSEADWKALKGICG